tara:strand:+ start:100 stop:2214 length:2115 start_codon:yes stop_codon:yes gene_type:complete
LVVSQNILSLRWEKQVVKLLDDLGLENVDGARGEEFQLGGHQIDAVAGFGDVLVVFECKLGQELKKRQVRRVISEMRGKLLQIKRGARNHPIYGKYEYVFSILLAKNYQFSEADKEYASEHPKISLKADEFFDYYNELYKKLGEFAKFDLLGELGVRRKKYDHLKTIALRSEYGKTLELYQFMLNPKYLLEIATVARREKRGENYYQRSMKDKKIKEIAEFVNKGKILPNSIIMAFDKDVKQYIRYRSIRLPAGMKQTLVNDIPNFGVLSFPLQFGSCWVIDGQHRLYAFAKGVSKDVNVPIIAFNGLSQAKQAKMFLDINKNQTTVDSDLVWDLNGELTPEEPDGIISNIVKDLNKLGPLKDKISMPTLGPMSGQKNRRKISSLCIVIKRLKFVDSTIYSKLENPMYSKTSIDQIQRNVVRELKEFYVECQSIFPEDWELGNQGWILDNSSGDVMTRMFEKIVAHSVRKNKTLNQKFYKKYLQPLSTHISGLAANGDAMKEEKNKVTSEGGKDDYVTKLCMIVRNATNEKDFGGELKSHMDVKFDKFELSLKEMIKAGLSDGKKDWLEVYVSSSTYGSAKAKAKARGETEPTNFYKFLTLGEAIGLVLSKDVFEGTFLSFFSQDSEFGFSGSSAKDIEDKIRSGFNEINKHRKMNVHPNPAEKMKAGDMKLLEANFEKISQCVEKAIEVLGGEKQNGVESEEE